MTETDTVQPDRIAIFLRGINLGRRRLTNDELSRPFRSAGFRGVECYQASGNVVVEASSAAALEEAALAAVEARVEEAMLGAVGFEAEAFARSLQRLASMTGEDSIVSGETQGFTPHVIFLKGAPDASTVDAFHRLETPDDRFPTLDREVVWLRRGRLSDSDISPNDIERALGRAPNTMRKITTLRRMVAKFGR